MLKCLAIAKGLKDFHIFYETDNASHDLQSIFRDRAWKVSYGFGAFPAKKVNQAEKSFLFNTMMLEFFKENLFPKEMTILINGVVGPIIYDFCNKHKYRIVKKDHVPGTTENPMDRNYFHLKKIKTRFSESL